MHARVRFARLSQGCAESATMGFLASARSWPPCFSRVPLAGPWNAACAQRSVAAPWWQNSTWVPPSSCVQVALQCILQQRR